MTANVSNCRLKKKRFRYCFMSTIEAILVGSERVKGHASKTKWKQCLLALTHDSPQFSIKVITRIYGEFLLHYIYIDKNFNESTTVCSL